MATPVSVVPAPAPAPSGRVSTRRCARWKADCSVFDRHARAPYELRELVDHRGTGDLAGVVAAHPVGDEEDRRSGDVRILVHATAQAPVGGGAAQHGDGGLGFAHAGTSIVALRSPNSSRSPARTVVRSPATSDRRAPSRTSTTPLVECRSTTRRAGGIAVHLEVRLGQGEGLVADGDRGRIGLPRGIAPEERAAVARRPACRCPTRAPRQGASRSPRRASHRDPRPRRREERLRARPPVRGVPAGSARTRAPTGS